MPEAEKSTAAGRVAGRADPCGGGDRLLIGTTMIRRTARPRSRTVGIFEQITRGWTAGKTVEWSNSSRSIRTGARKFCVPAADLAGDGGRRPDRPG